MSDEQKFGFSMMLGSETTVRLEIEGPIDRHIMVRLADLVALVERSILDQDEDEQEIEAHQEDVKARKRRPSRFIERDCEWHPGTPRNKANGCIECGKENGLRNKARFARTDKNGVVWSRPMSCPHCGDGNIRLYARAEFDKDVDEWFHVKVNARVPCVMPMVNYRSISIDREYTAKEQAAEAPAANNGAMK